MDNSLYRINVPHLVNLLIIIRMELNSVFIIDFLDSNNFIIKFNKTELYAFSGTCNNCNSLYSKYLEFLIL